MELDANRMSPPYPPDVSQNQQTGQGSNNSAINHAVFLCIIWVFVLLPTGCGSAPRVGQEWSLYGQKNEPHWADCEDGCVQLQAASKVPLLGSVHAKAAVKVTFNGQFFILISNFFLRMNTRIFKYFPPPIHKLVSRYDQYWTLVCCSPSPSL